MQSRRGVSLVEVLVASVLLGVGIAGTLNAFVASARLRVDADTRAALVGLMLDRLAWFEQRACASADTSGRAGLRNGPEAHWRLRAVGATRILEIDAAAGRSRVERRVRVMTSLSCG